jgi:hypothetical protein
VKGDQKVLVYINSIHTMIVNEIRILKLDVRRLLLNGTLAL